MSRIVLICHECNEDLQGQDSTICRFCHEEFCDDCGDLGTRVCNSCGDEGAEVAEFVKKEDKRRSVPEDEDEPEEEFGEVSDIDYFGDPV